MNDREETHLLSGAYALDAVTEDEATLIEAAMADSEELRSEITGLSDTAVALGLAVPPMAPPPALRARLLDAIEHLPQQTVDPVVEQASTPEVVTVAPESAPDVVTAMPAGDHVAPHRRRRARRPAMFLALAAAVVVLFSGSFLLQRTVFMPQSELAAIQQVPDHQEASSKMVGGGTMTVIWSKAEHRTAVIIDGVSAPAGKVLQMWTIRGGTPVDAGLYAPADDGNYAIISGTPPVGASIAVTVEPAGGSPQPTSTAIARVSLDA